MLSLPFVTNGQLDKPHHYTQNVYEIFILLINVQSGVSTILTTFGKYFWENNYFIISTLHASDSF